MLGLNHTSLCSNIIDDYASLSTERRWLLSAFWGIIMCKLSYEFTGIITPLVFKGFIKLSNAHKLEWKNRLFTFIFILIVLFFFLLLPSITVPLANVLLTSLFFFRGFSTFHALFVVVASLYFLLVSDLFDEHVNEGLIIKRRSTLSDTILGISSGYFLSDMAMIIWTFPTLGGLEYVLHHGLSMFAIMQSVLSGEAEMYIFMVLFTESTTPFVNIRWYLDVAGMKASKLYLWNGIAMFLGWLVARILLFGVFFYHLYNHIDEVKQVHAAAFYSLNIIPPVLAVMNLFWFFKIAKGMVRTLRKKKTHSHTN